ncbi:hypothetical protein ACTFIZ_007972 [Dictyostelium cf. discoideum]
MNKGLPSKHRALSFFWLPKNKQQLISNNQDVEPTKKQIYYSTDEHKRHVEEMVLKFIDLGIIKISESNYSSPIMLLKKRDSWRVVHHYLQLNKVTVRDDHPLTPVDCLLNQCKDSKLFSKFDMIMGYFQVLINPEHAKYTAFLNGRIPELPEPKNAKEAEAALESKGKNKKEVSDESIKEFNNLKKEFEGENIVAIPIEQDNNTPIDIEKVRATDMLIQSDNNNLNNGSFHLYCDVSDKALSGVLYQIQADKFKVIWFHSRKLSDTQKSYVLNHHNNKINNYINNLLLNIIINVIIVVNKTAIEI